MDFELRFRAIDAFRSGRRLSREEAFSIYEDANDPDMDVCWRKHKQDEIAEAMWQSGWRPLGWREAFNA